MHVHDKIDAAKSTCFVATVESGFFLEVDRIELKLLYNERITLSLSHGSSKFKTVFKEKRNQQSR